jgi:anti-anti-sigma factor
MSIVACAEGMTVRLGVAAGTPADLVERQLTLLVATRPPRVLLDLADLSHMSGAMLAAMLTLRRGVADYGGEVRIVGAQPIVLELFRRTGLDVVFQTRGREGSAA